MGRILDHLLYPRWRSLRTFPLQARRAVEASIRASEATHAGELRFVIEGGLDTAHLLRGIDSRQRAAEVFRRFKVGATQNRSGVLIYVQLADRRVEILADRGIHAKVAEGTWRGICALMEEAFAAGRFEAGAVAGVQAVGRVLAEHFPAGADKVDELPDTPEVL